MKVAILVAMEKEFKLLKDVIELSDEQLNHKYIIGSSGKNEILIAKCGIGKVNSAVMTSEIIRDFSPDVVVSSGVCGCLNKSGLEQGTVLINLNTRYHDVYCGGELGQIDGMPASFDSAAYSTTFINYLMSKNYKNVFGCQMISGDWFVDTAEKAHRIYDDCKLDEESIYAIDMESGSIAQTCHIYGTEFVGIRIVSDCPLCPDCAFYDDFWNNAPDTLNTIVQEFLNFI